MSNTGRVISAAARQGMYQQQTDEVFIILVTLDHANFTSPVRVSSDPTQDLPVAGVKGTVSNSEEYVYMPFTITLPSQDDSGISRAQIAIDNVSREVIQYVRSANSPVSIDIQIVLGSDNDSVEVSISDFRLEKVTYDALTISADLSVEFFDLEPYPRASFNPTDFPGLF